MSDRTSEIIWNKVAYRKAGYDAVVQLWRHGNTLLMSSTEGVMTLAPDERRSLAAMLMEGLEDKNK